MSLSQSYQRSTLAMLVLLATGYLGNYFNLSLFFRVKFLFGSIAVLLVVRFFGTKWGTLAAVVASLHTVLLWEHPYAAIIFICEALFVGLLLPRHHQNIVLLDGIYWVVIGMPLAWLFFSRFLHVDDTETWLIVLKQSVNGIFNALVANLLVTLSPIHKWIGRPQINNTLPLQQILLNLLMALVFFPVFTLMVVDGHRVTSNIQTKIQAELNSTSKDLIFDINTTHQQYLHALRQLGRVAIAFNTKQSEIIQESTELVQWVFPDFHNVYIIDPAARIIASYPTTNTLGASTISLGVANQSLLKETKTTLQASTSNVHIDSVLGIPHVDLSVPLVSGNRLSGFVYASLNLSNISKLLERHILAPGQQVTLVDQRSRIIASTQLERLPVQVFNRTGDEDIRSTNRATYLSLPLNKSIHDWQESFYVQETPIGGNLPWNLVVELPAASYYTDLQKLYIYYLAFMLLIAVITFILAVALSRRLASPLTKLARVTTNLPSKLLNREAIYWPNSPVMEIDSLVDNFKFVAIALNEKIQELQCANETLEQRVAERTAAVLQVNQQLASEIIERQRTEKDLRSSEEQFRQMAENINEVFWMSDPECTHLMYVSPAYEQIWERTCESLYANPKSWWDVIHPEDRERAMVAFKKYTEGKQDINYRIIRPDNSIRWIQDRTFPIRNELGEVYRVTGIASDITYRVQAEEEIRNALERERQLNELKSRFITTASHEFRTPLTIILMSAELLENYSHKATEEKKRTYLQRIQAATKRLTQLLDDVLIVGKAEAGKLEFNPAPMDLETFCHELVEEMQLLVGSKHKLMFITQFSTQLKNGEGGIGNGQEEIRQNSLAAYFCLDERLLRYILSNLLSNAVKYSPNGGIVKFELISEQGEAIFRIQDKGIGIPVADQKQLFNSFHRGSNTSNISGTGLGMTIVKQCVDLHGGNITFNSEVEVGTTFTVTLPLKRAK